MTNSNFAKRGATQIFALIGIVAVLVVVIITYYATQTRTTSSPHAGSVTLSKSEQKLLRLKMTNEAKALFTSDSTPSGKMKITSVSPKQFNRGKSLVINGKGFGVPTAGDGKYYAICLYQKSTKPTNAGGCDIFNWEAQMFKIKSWTDTKITADMLTNPSTWGINAAIVVVIFSNDAYSSNSMPFDIPPILNPSILPTQSGFADIKLSADKKYYTITLSGKGFGEYKGEVCFNDDYPFCMFDYGITETPAGINWHDSKVIINIRPNESLSPTGIIYLTTGGTAQLRSNSLKYKFPGGIK